MSLRAVVVYDCEFLTAPGAPQRFWCGPTDPDPLTIQIGAVRLSLEAPYTMSEAVGWYVLPMDRDGARVPLNPLVTKLTGITEGALAKEGVRLTDAMAALKAFAGDDPLLAWGKDELLSLAASLFVQGETSVIAPRQFRSAVPLVVQAGESQQVVETLRSHTICAHFGLKDPGPAHDARGDAVSVATVLKHLLASGRLSAVDVAKHCRVAD